jgi:hypothetical protein
MQKSILTIAAGLLLFPSWAETQDSPGQWRSFSERQPYMNPRVALNKDAEASDPAGIHYFAEDLAHLLLPDQAGDKYTNSFANHLAKAEREAREGKRKLIPDTRIIDAFNEIIKRANVPPTTASLDALRRFRTDIYLVKQYPALLTGDRNGTSCYPGEAVFLLTVLIDTDGHPEAPAPPPPPRANQPAPGATMFAREVQMGPLAGISLIHDRHRIVKIFSAVTRTFGI